MNLDIKSLEYGLKTYYEIKYEQGKIEFTELLSIVENIQYLNGWIEKTENQDPILIPAKELFEIEDLLKKYFRNEFLPDRDRCSIEEYLNSKRSGDFEFYVFFALNETKQKDSDFFRWVESTFRKIQQLKKYKRYNAYSVSKIISNITLEQYKNSGMKSLLLDYFEDQLKEALAHIHLNSALHIFKIKELENSPLPSKLSINQIALKYVYENQQITRANGNEIAKQYGHNSGEKLFQKFTYYSSTANRKSAPSPCTPKKLKNKIELIESVIALLPSNKCDRANDELLILRAKQDSDYQ